MATHSSVFAWRIPGMGEPDGLPSMGSHRVGHDWSNLAAAAALLRICQIFFQDRYCIFAFPLTMKESSYGLVSLSAFGVVSVLDLNHSKRHVGFPGVSVVKNPPANVEDKGLIPMLWWSLGEENGNPPQYSCLENPMGRGACRSTVHGIPESYTWVSS